MEAGSSSSVGEKLKLVMDMLLTRLGNGETVESPTVKFLLGEKERLEHMEAEEEKKREEKEKELEEEKKRKEEVVDETLRSIRALFCEGKTDTDPVVKSLLEEKDRLLEEKKVLDRQLVLLWGSRLGVGAAGTSFAGTEPPLPQPVPVQGAADTVTLLETAVEGISNLQQLIPAEKSRGQPKGFSSVGSEEADGMLRELDFDEVNGNALCPIKEEEKLSASATRSFQFAGGDKGQAVTELLAAYAVNHFPLLLDLTDGNVHHLLYLTDSALVFWENLTPTAAYYKQAEVLTSHRQASSPHLRLQDIPEEEGVPLKKMRKWRPENGLLAQLSCLEDLPADTRVQTALELFHSWSHITPPPLPMPEAVAHFYA